MVKVCATPPGSTELTVRPSTVIVPPTVPITRAKNGFGSVPPVSYWSIVKGMTLFAGTCRAVDGQYVTHELLPLASWGHGWLTGKGDSAIDAVLAPVAVAFNVGGCDPRLPIDAVPTASASTNPRPATTVMSAPAITAGFFIIDSLRWSLGQMLHFGCQVLSVHPAGVPRGDAAIRTQEDGRRQPEDGLVVSDCPLRVEQHVPVPAHGKIDLPQKGGGVGGAVARVDEDEVDAGVRCGELDDGRHFVAARSTP